MPRCIVWLVAGLGNPGKQYEGTRHNAGFDVVDVLAGRAGVSLRSRWRFPAATAEIRDGDERLLLVKPRTFMNRSGLAVGPVMQRNGLALSDLIVVVDDTELRCGRIRIRRSGSAGGHNGLKSVAAVLGSDAFTRIRVGVGGQPDGQEMVKHVLGRFKPDERKEMKVAMERAADAVWVVVRDGVDRAMNTYNG
jgi:peptidyl-tRNA hydrolase, PTH1 family